VVTLVKIRVLVRFQVLTAASMKFRGFLDVAPCSQVDVDYMTLHPSIQEQITVAVQYAEPEYLVKPIPQSHWSPEVCTTLKLKVI
jgi:hypothetical protein